MSPSFLAFSVVILVLFLLLVPTRFTTGCWLQPCVRSRTSLTRARPPEPGPRPDYPDHAPESALQLHAGPSALRVTPSACPTVHVFLRPCALQTGTLSVAFTPSFSPGRCLEYSEH